MTDQAKLEAALLTVDNLAAKNLRLERENREMLKMLATARYALQIAGDKKTAGQIVALLNRLAQKHP